MNQPRKIRTSSRLQQLPQPVYTFTQVQAIQQQQQQILQIQKEERAKQKLKEEKQVEVKAIVKPEIRFTKVVLQDPFAAQPSKLYKRQRRFCDVCGYWGKYRCIKDRCPISYCSLQCKGVHDETRCKMELMSKVRARADISFHFIGQKFVT
jgi:hypothetical protein